jgi:hypothetical protein
MSILRLIFSLDTLSLAIQISSDTTRETTIYSAQAELNKLPYACFIVTSAGRVGRGVGKT